MNTVITSKEAILSASKQIAASQGMQAINMRAVAGICGVAVGSVYNYFPSKADLVAATVEDIWKSIFHTTGNCNNFDNFVDCVKWLFESIRTGTSDYPSFFTVHSIGFEPIDKAKGRQVMSNYLEHMKKGLLEALHNDQNIKCSVFCENFTKEAFVDFVFLNLLTLLMKNEQSCDVLIEVIKRVVY